MAAECSEMEARTRPGQGDPGSLDSAPRRRHWVRRTKSCHSLRSTDDTDKTNKHCVPRGHSADRACISKAPRWRHSTDEPSTNKDDATPDRKSDLDVADATCSEYSRKASTGYDSGVDIGSINGRSGTELDESRSGDRFVTPGKEPLNNTSGSGCGVKHVNCKVQRWQSEQRQIVGP